MGKKPAHCGKLDLAWLALLAVVGGGLSAVLATTVSDLSEFYGEHVSRALGAMDRRVDEARAAVPINGTDLRADYFAGRAYLAPRV